MKKLFLIIFILFFTNPAYAWVSGYSYRKQMTITGSSAGAQTNYQMKLNVFKGSASSTILRPNAAGDSSTFIGCGSTNYTCVDDETADDNTAYLWNLGGATHDLYNLSNPTPLGTIYITLCASNGTAFTVDRVVLRKYIYLEPNLSVWGDDEV